eukprot:1676169-Amphidinium_carterae.1
MKALQSKRTTGWSLGSNATTRKRHARAQKRVLTPCNPPLTGVVVETLLRLVDARTLWKGR